MGKYIQAERVDVNGDTIVKQLQIANHLNAVRCMSLFSNTYNKTLLNTAIENIGTYPEPDYGSIVKIPKK